MQMWTSKQFSHSVLTCSITGSASSTRSRKKNLTAKWNHSFSGLMSSKNCHNCSALASLVCDWQRHQSWARCTMRKVYLWMFPAGSVVSLCLWKHEGGALYKTGVQDHSPPSTPPARFPFNFLPRSRAKRDGTWCGRPPKANDRLRNPAACRGSGHFSAVYGNAHGFHYVTSVSRATMNSAWGEIHKQGPTPDSLCKIHIAAASLFSFPTSPAVEEKVTW